MVNHFRQCDFIHDSPRKKGFSIPGLVQVYKTFVLRWNRRRRKSASNNDPKTGDQKSFRGINKEIDEEKGAKNRNQRLRNSGESIGEVDGLMKCGRSMDNFLSSAPSRLSRVESRRSSCSVQSVLNRYGSRKSTDSGIYSIPECSRLSRAESRRSSCSVQQSLLNRNGSRKSTDSGGIHGITESLSRSASRCRSGNPIMYSNSAGMMKPPPVEKKLECTLEELCFGCKKKIQITRDQIITKSGQVIQEEETLTIEVKPGWTNGTKITFEGTANDRPGALPADVILVIDEKKHHVFRREGDDLELALSIPLVKALTGCTIPIPLLGGQETTITIEDIIHPGYEKIISRQGMYSAKEEGKRGDLKVEFMIQFPTDLTDEQRNGIVGILEQSCS